MADLENETAAYPWRSEPEIDAERQKFLTGRLAIEPGIKEGIYPFKDVRLTRADIEWLLATHEDGRGPVDWNDLQQRERLGLDLRGADLRQVDLRNLPLARTYGGLVFEESRLATLEQRHMASVNFQGSDLSRALLQGAILRDARLQEANLREAHLEEATLYRAHLEHAYLRGTHFEQANLGGIHLEGAYLRKAHVEGADLRDAFLNIATSFEETTLSAEKCGCARLADVHWSEMNLSLVDWTRVTILGDEDHARRRTTKEGKVKSRSKRVDDYRAAVRANRQLASAMRAQGMNEEAILFAYRAQVLQRKVLWRQVLWGQSASPQTNLSRLGLRQHLQDVLKRARTLAAYIFSCFLDVLAGYGYKPGRSVVIYLLVIAGFAVCYFLFGHLSAREALIFSVTSFHGRGFLPGPFALSSPVTALTALEAVVGLFIEISFIATFTQRFFGR